MGRPARRSALATSPGRLPRSPRPGARALASPRSTFSDNSWPARPRASARSSRVSSGARCGRACPTASRWKRSLRWPGRPSAPGGAARRGPAPFILDGEVLALAPAGRPLPFQELMRRFRRVHRVDELVRTMPLALYFFDCLMADGRSLIDEPYELRWEALAAVTGGRYLAERIVVTDAEAGRAFFARALEAGHAGGMAKDLRSPYEPRGRG